MYLLVYVYPIQEFDISIRSKNLTDMFVAHETLANELWQHLVLWSKTCSNSQFSRKNHIYTVSGTEQLLNDSGRSKVTGKWMLITNYIPQFMSAFNITDRNHHRVRPLMRLVQPTQSGEKINTCNAHLLRSPVE